MDILAQLAAEFSLRQEQVDHAVALLDDGKTVPFIARYRKEQTGSLDDQTLHALSDRLNYLRKLEERKQEICDAIAALEKLTPELEEAIFAAKTVRTPPMRTPPSFTSASDIWNGRPIICSDCPLNNVHIAFTAIRKYPVPTIIAMIVLASPTQVASPFPPAKVTERDESPYLFTANPAASRIERMMMLSIASPYL